MGENALRAAPRFQHEAVLYHGVDDFASATLPFIRAGIDRGEPVLVAVPPDRIRRLRSVLGADAHHVAFVDITSAGGNPGRIIPLWRRFVDDTAWSGPARGIGEPVWPGRSEAELDECRLHESLLNVAFDHGPAWRLLCPYDAESLPGPVLEDARRAHPVVGAGPDGCPAAHLGQYAGHDFAREQFAAPLSPTPESARRVCFRHEHLADLRRLVRTWALEAGLSGAVASNAVLAAHELATNSIVHGEGCGVVRSWTEPGSFVLQIQDEGRISDPLVGRELALGGAEGGRGVWIAYQVCDLLQLRSSESGTVARLRFRR